MRRRVAFATLLVLSACARDRAPTQVTPPGDSTAATTTVSFPGGTVTAKIASTYAARDTGLMYVTTLDANAGMLFVFGTDHSYPDGFWMKNTSLPLSIAFIDANMKVINIDDMAPETLTPHYATGPYRYALEVNQGWFASHGVAAGAAATFALPAGTITDP